MKKVFFLYLLLIVHFSLYPWSFALWHAPLRGVLQGWHPLVGRRDWFDIVVNFLFYMPFGALGVLAWRNGRGAWRRWTALAAAGMALSLALETLQAWVPGRDSSVQDVVMNSLGTLAGIVIGIGLGRHHAGGAKLPLRRPMALLLAAAWVCAQMFPFLPVLNRWSLQRALEHLAGITPVSGLHLAEAFLGGLLLSFLLRAALGPALWRVSLAAAVLIPLVAAFIQGVAFSWPAFTAATLAFWISTRSTGRPRSEAALLACLALLLIAAKEFYPFHLSAVPAPFHWMPFAGFLEFDHQSAVRIVAAKFFLYGAAVWTLRETGLALWGSAGVVTLLLALGEAAQRYLPGRVPESTDPLLALLAAVLMVWLKDRPSTR